MERPLQRSSGYCSEAQSSEQAHVEFREDLEKEKKKRRSRDRLLVRVWKGVKAVLKHLSRSTKTPQATRMDIPKFSFLNGLEEGATSDSSGDSDEASS
ncbi:hypothetical protein HAX54_010854 [Datura stramonium]|uniref:Uncharacterized protein n=1 Tax=Datura stramonium TaxID=4076 RepID=A0ABS8TGW4_DATST|nr:hypothetical protein [Datura stramonium]